MSQIDNEEELEFSEPRAWIPDGCYMAKCLTHSKLIPYRNTRKIFLIFEILTEPYRGEKIFMAFNMGFGPISPGMKYYKYWVVANNNRVPSRNAKASPRMFINKIYMVTTRTVKPRVGPSLRHVNDAGMEERELPFEAWYSVIDHFELVEMENLPDIESDEKAYGY